MIEQGVSIAENGKALLEEKGWELVTKNEEVQGLAEWCSLALQKV